MEVLESLRGVSQHQMVPRGVQMDSEVGSRGFKRRFSGVLWCYRRVRFLNRPLHRLKRKQNSILLDYLESSLETL